MVKSLTEPMVKDSPRLNLESRFKFSCRKGLDCFTRCCANVNIFLTPYDVLRMKKALNISSGEFLEKYTVAPLMSEQKLPLVLLKMRDDGRKSCPFVTPQGCSIYDDRPWSCRMFPLDIASSKTDEPSEFGFIVGKDFPCLGFKEDKERAVSDWFVDQGIDIYDNKSRTYKDITLHPVLVEGEGLGPSKTMMFYLTCYDLDRFRELLLKSTFFSRFEVPPEVVERIKTDDEALLDFGYDWLKFSLLGEDTIKVKGEVLEDRKKVLFQSEGAGKTDEKRRKRKLSK